MKDCPFCGEKILIDALKCRYCKEWLEEPSIAQVKTPEVEEPPREKTGYQLAMGALKMQSEMRDRPELRRPEDVIEIFSNRWSEESKEAVLEFRDARLLGPGVESQPHFVLVVDGVAIMAINDICLKEEEEFLKNLADMSVGVAELAGTLVRRSEGLVLGGKYRVTQPQINPFSNSPRDRLPDRRFKGRLRQLEVIPAGPRLHPAGFLTFDGYLSVVATFELVGFGPTSLEEVAVREDTRLDRLD